jgi:carbamoyl-phosphate synthase large subunit
VVNNRQELLVFSRRTPNCIVQEFVEGTEYTCDVYIDLDMKVRCVVPRRRIEVRAGEVSKGQVIKNEAIMNRAAEFAKALKAGPGVITVQCFLRSDGRIVFTDINPRFGGGVPLAIKAGANFPKWILEELTGRKLRIKFDGFKNNLIMLRYDAEVWLDGS